MNRFPARLVAGMAATVLLAGCGSSQAAKTAAATNAGKADVAKAKEQARSFHTISMPDDWNNYGVFFTQLCQVNNLDCDGKASGGANRKDNSDASSADVIDSFKNNKSDPDMCGDIGIAFTQAVEKQGVGLGYAPVNADKIPPRYKGANNSWFGHVTGTISILANSKALKARGAEVPKSFADLKKPEYQGLVFMKNPQSSGTGQATVLSAAMALGGGKFDLDASFKYFAELQRTGQFTKAKFSGSAFEKGETPIQLAYDYVNLETAKGMRAKGIDAQVVIPAEGGIWAPSAMVCNAGSKAPDLAKLTLDFALSDTGQRIFAQIGAHPVRYVTGDIQLTTEEKKNWLPEGEYAKVKEYQDEKWPSAADIAKRWEADVLNAK